jgi:DNA-binding response OmpR family regulator
MKLLLLEDDRETAAALVSGLRAAGYEPSAAHDVASASALLATRVFDAAILDLVVPGGSGYEVLDRLRRQTAGVPVLVLTARDSVEDRVEGLNRGADDYLVKPFSFPELLARLRSILRRPRQRVERMTLANLELDPLQRSASVDGKALDLSTKEFELLRFLVEQPGEVRSRAALLERVWGIRFDPGTNVIDVHVSRLRSKLRIAGAKVSIQARRGIGYVAE